MKRLEVKITVLLTLPALALLIFASLLTWQDQRKPVAPYQVLENKIVQEACPPKSEINEPTQQCLVHRVKVKFHPANLLQRKLLGLPWSKGYGDTRAFNARTGAEVGWFVGVVPEPEKYGVINLYNYYSVAELKAEKAKIVFEAYIWWGDSPGRYQKSLILRQNTTPEKLKSLKNTLN